MPNTLLSFSSGVVALGGAFHAAVEVCGGEWMYGSNGVRCIPPRSDEGHVYECSIYMGRTMLDREQLACVLHELAQQWPGEQYDLLSRNCCSFAAAMCQRLGVGELPRWVDRLPRLLHGGREAGIVALQAALRARSATIALMQELPAVAAQPCDEQPCDDRKAVHKLHGEVAPRLEQGAACGGA